MTQYSCRDRDQYVPAPVDTVRRSASASIQATISTSLVSYCCTTAHTRPSSLNLTPTTGSAGSVAVTTPPAGSAGPDTRPRPAAP